jgi:hypothetical protein
MSNACRMQPALDMTQCMAETVDVCGTHPASGSGTMPGANEQSGM